MEEYIKGRREKTPSDFVTHDDSDEEDPRTKEQVPETIEDNTASSKQREERLESMTFEDLKAALGESGIDHEEMIGQAKAALQGE